MSEFLFGPNLSKRIRQILTGQNVKCAVAFWGNNQFEGTPEQQGSWNIVCDLSMGATSPDELVRLGAPDNRNLRYFPGLHAKVYISDEGMVVGSANASARALGADGRPAVLVEAGSFHQRDSADWKAASLWFARLFAESNQVDQDALNEARRRYRPPASNIDRRLAAMTTLQQIVVEPEHYEEAGVGFVVVRRGTTPQERRDAISQAVAVAEHAGIAEERLFNWRSNGIFVGWGDLANLRLRFVEFYLGERGGRSISRHQVVLRDDGNFFTEKTNQISAGNGDRFPATLVDSDWAILEAVSKLANFESSIFTATTFAEAVRQVLAMQVSDD